MYIEKFLKGGQLTAISNIYQFNAFDLYIVYIKNNTANINVKIFKNALIGLTNIIILNIITTDVDIIHVKYLQLLNSCKFNKKVFLKDD